MYKNVRTNVQKYTLEAFHLVTRLLFKNMEFLVGTFFDKSYGEMAWTQMIKNKKNCSL